AVQRINADLANGLGNLAQRTLSFIYKNFEGKIPVPNALMEDDKKILALAHDEIIQSVRKNFDKFLINRTLEDIWQLVTAANGYIDVQAPWTLKKTDPARMNTVLYVLTEVIRCLGIL